jgi:hypothetical protein
LTAVKATVYSSRDRGGQRAAVIYRLIVTAKSNDVVPQAWLAHVLANIAQHHAEIYGRHLYARFSPLPVRPAAPVERPPRVETGQTLWAEQTAGFRPRTLRTCRSAIGNNCRAAKHPWSSGRSRKS